MVSVHEDVEARIAAHQSFVDAAAGVGLGLLAYLSIVNPSPTAAFHHGRSHAATERMILASGMPYAFLRMNLFLDDLPLWFDPDGVCRGPGGDGRVALISREDTAAVSAGVLAGPGYENEALDLTGEESHSLGELAALCSELTGRPLRYEPGTREAWLESRIAAGIAPWDANIGVGSYEALLRRRVRRDLGRRAARHGQAGPVGALLGRRPTPGASPIWESTRAVPGPPSSEAADAHLPHGSRQTVAGRFGHRPIGNP